MRQEVFADHVVVGVDEVGVIRKPADPEHDQDHDEHLGQLSLILDPPPVDQRLVRLVVCPENTPQVTVSDGQSHHRDHVGYQEEHDLRKYKNQIRSSCRALDINLVVVVE